MLIDVANTGSFPEESRKTIVDYFRAMPKSVLDELSQHQIKSPRDVKCSLQKLFQSIDPLPLIQKINSDLATAKVIFYHATRLISRNDLHPDGIKVPTWEHYKEYLARYLRQHHVSDDEINKALNLILVGHRNKNQPFETIHFFTPIDMIYMNDDTGFDVYCENIGGELARWALEYKMPHILRLLKDGGEPLILRFILPHKNILSTRRDVMTECFIYHVASKLLWDFNYPICFDAMTQFNIPFSDILEIISLNKVLEESQAFRGKGASD